MASMVTIDPGQKTGVIISGFEKFGNFYDCGTIRDCGKIVEYVEKLRDMKDRHEVVFAVVEEYVNDGMKYSNAFRVQEQVRACLDVFETHITVKNCQWNPMHHNKRYQKRLAAGIYGSEFRNEHETSAALIHRYFVDRIYGWSSMLNIPCQDVAIKLARDFKGSMPNREKLDIWIRKLREEKKVRFAV